MVPGSEPHRPARPFEPADLQRLDPDDFRTLAYASAIGPEFDFELLADAMGAEGEALAEPGPCAVCGRSGPNRWAAAGRPL